MSEMHDSANNIAYLLTEAASDSGARAALAIPASDSADVQVVSYAQLASAAAQVQRHLAALGVERGVVYAECGVDAGVVLRHCGCGCDLCSVESAVVGC